MPFSFTLPEAVAPKAIEPSEAAKVNGRDVMFSDGNIQIGPNGDWLTVEGLPNLKQGVLRRLLTKPGEYRARPEYGVGAQTFVKSPASSARLDELRQRIIGNLSRDPRIDDVIDVDVTAEFLPGTDKRVHRAFIRVKSRGQEVRLKALDIGTEV